jgi:hypothetical protein|tara:strand:- start:146 stop:1531 length:1386 start_codon:yes stop_codon:yes gene_type:complete
MALGNLGKYSQLLQNMPNPNTGTHAGGLSHVLQQALLGYSTGQNQRAEEATQGRYEQMLRAMTGTPDTQGFAPDHTYNPPGAFGAGVGGPPPPPLDPDRAQITIPGEAPDLMGAINIGAGDPALQELTFGLLNQRNQNIAAAEAAEAARLQGIEDARSQFMFELENSPPPERQIIEGSDGLNYYTDTGEQVLANQVPTVAQGPSTASVMTGEDLGIPGDTNSYEVTSQDGVITNISNLGSGTSIDIDLSETEPNAARDTIMQFNVNDVSASLDAAATLNGYAYDLNAMYDVVTGMADDDFLQSGAGSETMLDIAKWGEAFGLTMSENASDLELLRSISNRIAPSMRQPGSGSTSDVEFQAFMESLPHMSTTKRGNLAIISHLNAMTEYANDMALIKKQALFNTGSDVMGYDAEVKRLTDEKFGGQTGYLTSDLPSLDRDLYLGGELSAEDEADQNIMFGEQ